MFWLGRDIFQMPISYVQITAGIEEVRCVRLTDKGMHRWYAECCKTAIGNSLGPAAPFMGVIHTIMDNGSTRELDVGPVRGYWRTEAALGTVPPEHKANTSMFRIITRAIFSMGMWKLRGLNKPSSFFTADGTPISKPIVLKTSRSQ